MLQRVIEEVLKQTSGGKGQNKSGGAPSINLGGSKVNALLTGEADTDKEVEENFEEPIIPDLAFNHKWTIWEQYDGKGSHNYKETMMKVAWFADPITFWRVWNKIPHSDTRKFFSFSREGKTYVNYYEVKGVDEKISSLAMFKTGVIPAWEDPNNRLGGDFNLKVSCNEDNTNKVWNSLVLDIVTDNFPHTERVCGIRVLDKGSQIKVELWVDYKEKSAFEGSAAQESRLKEILES